MPGTIVMSASPIRAKPSRPRDAFAPLSDRSVHSAVSLFHDVANERSGCDPRRIRLAVRDTRPPQARCALPERLKANVRSLRSSSLLRRFAAFDCAIRGDEADGKFRSYRQRPIAAIVSRVDQTLGVHQMTKTSNAFLMAIGATTILTAGAGRRAFRHGWQHGHAQRVSKPGCGPMIAIGDARISASRAGAHGVRSPLE